MTAARERTELGTVNEKNPEKSVLVVRRVEWSVVTTTVASATGSPLLSFTKHPNLLLETDSFCFSFDKS